MLQMTLVGKELIKHVITDPPELQQETQLLTAEETWQSFSSALTSETIPPSHRQEWKIDAPAGHVISYYVSTIKLID